MKRLSFFHRSPRFLLLVLFSLSPLLFLSPVVVNAQWEPDVRLTNDNSASRATLNNGHIIAAAPGGLLHLVWRDKRDGDNGEIYYKRSTDQGITWSADLRLTQDSAWSSFPSISSSDSTVQVVWNDDRDGNNEVYYIGSTDAGAHWTPEIRLTDDTSSSVGPSISCVASYVHLVWSDQRDGTWKVYYKRSTDSGLTWSQDIRLSDTTGWASSPSVSASGDYVHVVWNDGRDGNDEIYTKRSTDRGITWSPDTRLTQDPAMSLWPSIWASGTDVHTAWVDERYGNREIFYKHSTDEGIPWSPDTSLTYGVNYSDKPSITSTDMNVHIVWNTDSDIFYKRSTDRGATWSPDLLLPDIAGVSDFPFIALSGAMVHVVWVDMRDGPQQNTEIYYKRNPTGNGVENLNGSGKKIAYNRIIPTPNPFISFATIPGHSSDRFVLYDISGRKVGTYRGDRIGEGLTAGVYFLRKEGREGGPVRVVKVR